METPQRSGGDVVIDLVAAERVTAEEFVSTAYEWAAELADEVGRLASKLDERDLTRAATTILDRRRANPLAGPADGGGAEAWRWQLVTDLLHVVEARGAATVAV